MKSPGRQNEAYRYGAAGWLNDVDGVGYKIKASKETPINRDAKGASSLIIVKDRYRDVQRLGILDDDGDRPPYYMGSFVVDDTGAQQELWVTVPSKDGGQAQDRYDQLGQRVWLS